LFVGEALGAEEVKAGKPFVGPAGQTLDRIISKVGLDRGAVRVDNCIRCRPPENKLVGTAWEHPALAQCTYLDDTLREPHKAIVALGATATKRLLSLGSDKFALNNWHGLPVMTQWGWVIPTYHPSFIMQGNQKHVSTVCFAIQNAKEVAQKGWQKEDATLIVDPPVAEFKAWMDRVRPPTGGGNTNPEESWLAVDIETPQKPGRPEDELVLEEAPILRVNFAVRGDFGVTVPYQGLHREAIDELLARPGHQVYWNKGFDVPRLLANGVKFHQDSTLYDFMWAWHVLQSDLPRGLGFVAPFYSRFGAWKHLSGSNPGEYAAIDAVQTIRVAKGIERDLIKTGQWDAFFRHVYELDTKVLEPATAIGLPVDLAKLANFDDLLAASQANYKDMINGMVGSSLKRHPKGGWKRFPKLPCTINYKRGTEKLAVTYTESDIEREETEEGPRYYVREPFNPDSPAQLLEIMKVRGHGHYSTEKKVLERLGKRDPFYRTILDYRGVSKVRSTYVRATQSRAVDARLHATFTHRPSTMRLSCVNPNLQNVVSDRSADAPSSGFRNCIVAEKGCVFIEADFAAIEAVETGWFAGDGDYVRLARLGVHAYLASHILNKPADLKWSDEDLASYFREIKRDKDTYDRAKRIVHGTSYGLSAYGLSNYYPEQFTKKSAEELQALFFELCPKLKAWHKDVRDTAHKLHYLGGNNHPFKYKHWFWDVYTYRNGQWVLGKDGNRVIAFYPQSTSAGVLYDAALRLTNPDDPAYIGSMWHGKTPIRALIHDSILLEVPKLLADAAIEALYSAMTRPILSQPIPATWGSKDTHLKIGIGVKVGESWGSMELVEPGVGVSLDTAINEEEEENEA
jgi:uracil-DNA glycosylase family 4